VALKTTGKFLCWHEENYEQGYQTGQVCTTHKGWLVLFSFSSSPSCFSPSPSSFSVPLPLPLPEREEDNERRVSLGSQQKSVVCEVLFEQFQSLRHVPSSKPNSECLNLISINTRGEDHYPLLCHQVLAKLKG
jgi:hypothetical protein